MVALLSDLPLDPGASIDEIDDAIESDECVRSFATFVQHAWHTVHSEEEQLIWTWAMQAVCDHMQAVAERRIKRLIIAIPPGFAKSLIVSVFYPAWQWARTNGRYQVLAVSGLQDLATRDALRCRDVVESDWYQRTFRPQWGWDEHQDAKTFFKTTLGGIRWSRTVGQRITGMRPGTPGGITIDDPLDATEAYEDKAGLQRVNVWFRYALSTRKAVGLIKTPIVIICQRLHVMDLPGTLLSTPEGREQWDYLCIPQEWDGRKKEPTSIGWVDPREKIGEFIDERLFGPADRDEAMVDLTRLGYATQHQQIPTPVEGLIHNVSMIRHWNTLPGPSPWKDLVVPEGTRWRQLIISADCTYTKTTDSDRAAAGVWGLGRDNLVYFLDAWCHKATPTELIAAIKVLIRRWEVHGNRIATVVVETKSSGKEVVKHLKESLIKVWEYDPQGVSKIERVMATLHLWEHSLPGTGIGPSGESIPILIPDPLIRIPPVDRCPWVRDEYLPELLGFPLARHDDWVDQGSQALLWFRNRNLLTAFARGTAPD